MMNVLLEEATVEGKQLLLLSNETPKKIERMFSSGI